MALIVQDPTVGSLLQRLFGLQGRVRPQLEEFIIPTVQIADLSEGTRLVERRHVSAVFDQAAVVGERPVLRLETPPSVIMNVTRITYTNDSGAVSLRAFFGSSIPVPANTAVKVLTDQRVREDLINPGGVLTFGTQAAGLGAIHWRQQLEASDLPNVIEPSGWVVGSLNAVSFGFLEFDLNGTNIPVAGSIEWDEYGLF